MAWRLREASSAHHVVWEPHRLPLLRYANKDETINETSKVAITIIVEWLVPVPSYERSSTDKKLWMNRSQANEEKGPDVTTSRATWRSPCHVVRSVRGHAGAPRRQTKSVHGHRTSETWREGNMKKRGATSLSDKSSQQLIIPLLLNNDICAGYNNDNRQRSSATTWNFGDWRS